MTDSSLNALNAVQEKNSVLNWCVTPIYIVLFFLILILSHPVHVIASFFGRRLHKKALDLMNLCIIWNIRLVTGASYRVIGTPALPGNRSVIIISNHQSMYDIPMIMWACRKRELGFIAKKELGRWIPSISFALRRLGSVLIDRKDTAQSIKDIERFGQEKEAQKQVAVIFPEGTRARNGDMRKFKAMGLRTLLRSMPSALVQPVAIRGNWELLQYNFLPVPYGTRVELEFLEPMEPRDYAEEDLVAEVERRIRKAVGLEIFKDSV